jgi:predicted  nucleic acid-binding Zn-ribbon protein
MADDYSINAKITADNSGFKKSVEEASKSIGNFGKTLSTFKTAVAGAFVVKGIHEFTKAMNECAKLYVVQAKAEKTLEVASKNNPYLNGDSVKALKSYASELQNISEIGDEQLLPMMAQLAAAGRDQNEIQNIMKAAVDISASGMMSLESAVKSLSGSYAGQIGQLGKLLPQLKNLTTEELENGKAVEIAGKAYEGIAQSTANSSKQLQNSIGDLKEQLGYGWETAFSPMRKGLKDIIDRWTEALKKANDAKKAMTNLDTVVTSGGSAGNVKDAKGTQKDINDRLQKEYRELSRLADLSAKKLKERTKAEKAEYADLIIAYDSYLAKYKLMADTEVEAVRMAQEDKKKEWQKGLNDFQLIIAKEKELEEEQTRIDAENASQEAINRRKALTDAYDETIAKAREEIEIHRQMGEKITKEEESAKMLEVMKQAYVKMIQESNGELKIEKTRLESIIKLQKELNKQLPKSKSLLEELQRMTKEMLENSESEWNDFEQAVINVYDEILEEASTWSDFFTDMFHSFSEIGKEAIETIGRSMVEGEDAWKNMGAVALESIAQILEALAKELTALAVVKAVQYDFASAGMALAGATAALIGAGALKGIASQMKTVSKDTQTLVDALKDLKNELKSIESAGSAGKISNIASAYAQSVNAVKEAQTVLVEKATSETYDVYLQSLQSYSKSVNNLDDSLKELNDTLDLQAKAFREIYSETDKVSKNIVKNKVLSDLKTQLDSAYSDLENIGKTIGETMFNGIAEGASSSNFLTDVKKYIVNAMTKIAVFTESFQKQLADATSGMLVGITTGDDSIIENSTKAIKNLYETALSTANAIEGSITGIFNNINTKTNATVRSLNETINDIKKEGFTDLSKTLQGRSSLTQQIDKAKSELDEALNDYQSSSIPNAISKLTYGEKAGYTRQINELQRAINTYSEKIIELNKQRESLEWTVGHSAPSELYRGDEKFFQEYLVYLNMGIDKATALMKAGLNESWADQKWNWEMAKRDLEDVNSAINTYQNLIKNTTPRIDEYNEKIKETDSKISELSSEYKNLEKAYKDAEKNYQDALDLINKSMRELSDNLKAQNKELDNQILLYKELYTSTDASFNSAVLETSLNKIKSAFYSFFEDLQDMGLTVGENLVNAIADGMSQADFLSSMKDYIRKAIIQTVVYTETLQHEIAQIGATISKGIAEGFTDTGLHEIKRDLSYIFYMAQNSISKIDTVLDNVFSGYATGTQSATRGLHLVGEAGPELVRFRGGEQVLNANNTQKALNGAGTTINQNVTFNNLNDTSAFAMMQQFKRYNREMAINGIF